MVVDVDTAPVHIELFFESLCPGCRGFITQLLVPTWQKLQDSGIMRVSISTALLGLL